MQANLPTWHGAKQGEDGGGTPPKRRAGRPARGPRRTDRIQCGPRRSRALSGPPWSASSGWGSGRDSSPWNWGTRVSKTDGPQSLDLQRGALETAGVDAVNVNTTSRPVSRRSPNLDRDAVLHRVFDCPKLVDRDRAGHHARQGAAAGSRFNVVHAPLLCLKGRSLRRDRP